MCMFTREEGNKYPNCATQPWLQQAPDIDHRVVWGLVVRTTRTTLSTRRTLFGKRHNRPLNMHKQIHEQSSK